eukprot:SAG31_NODE_394_length_16282_cov_132.890564_12_plen_92_part_00
MPSITYTKRQSAKSYVLKQKLTMTLTQTVAKCSQLSPIAMAYHLRSKLFLKVGVSFVFFLSFVLEERQQGSKAASKAARGAGGLLQDKQDR